MPHPRCNPKTLQNLDECIRTAKAKHSEQDVLAAARCLELENYLPDVYTLLLFPQGTPQ
jgi:hypothetical protein